MFCWIKIRISFNSAAEKLERVRREEIIGKSVALVFPNLVEYKLLESLPEELQTSLPSIEQIERELGNLAE